MEADQGSMGEPVRSGSRPDRGSTSRYAWMQSSRISLNRATWTCIHEQIIALLVKSVINGLQPIELAGAAAIIAWRSTVMCPSGLSRPRIQVRILRPNHTSSAEYSRTSTMANSDSRSSPLSHSFQLLSKFPMESRDQI